MHQKHQRNFFLGLLLFVLLHSSAWAQQDIKSSTSDLLKDYLEYFKEDRKSIHLHLNKTTFASGEHIWFSTYLFNKKTNLIDDEDTYIYVDLLDSEGTIITSKTIAYTQTSGTGEFYLDPKMESGDYFLQVYTAEMNRFEEDDSSIYPIRIINFESNVTMATTLATDIKDLRVSIQAESGHLLTDVFGTCGIRITDLNGKPILPDSVVLSTKATPKKSILVPMNAMGTGKFSLTPKRGVQHIVRTYFNRQVLTTSVPLSKETGYTIATDHNYTKRQLLVAVHTNETTLNKKKDSLIVVIHKDGNAFTLSSSIPKNGLSKNLIIPYASLYPGVNTLSLFKNGSELIAERMVFNQPRNEKLKPKVLKANRSKDSITLYIKNYSPKKSSSLNKASISVLPSENKATKRQKSIASSFFLEGYVPEEFIHRIQQSSYLERNVAKYDLDVLLLVQGKGKYEWKNILKSAQKLAQTTPNTSAISGYVNMFDTPNDSMQVMLYSTSNGIFETAELDAEKKFVFNAVSVAKKSKITLTLLDKNGEPVYANFFFTIQPMKKPYRFPHQPRIASYQKTIEKDMAPLPSIFKKVEQLDEVVVTENKLKYGNFFGKFNGRKVDSTLRQHINLENYVRTLGYNMTFVDPRYSDIKRAASPQLYRTCVNSYGNTIRLFPFIVFNGVFSKYLMDYSHVRMDQIDEIYYLKSSSPLRCSDGGFFVVFTNENYENRPLAEVDKNSKVFTIENGHDLPKEFVRPPYYAFDSDNYKRYGIVSWIPDIVSNKQGVISFKIPDDGQSKLKVHLEGFGEHGEYLSDTLTLDLNKEP